MAHHSPQTPGPGSSVSNPTQPAAAAGSHQSFEDLRRIVGKLPSGDPLRDAYLTAEIACQCLCRLHGDRAWLAALAIDEGSRRQLARLLERGHDATQHLANDLWHYAPEAPQALAGASEVAR